MRRRLLFAAWVIRVILISTAGLLWWHYISDAKGARKLKDDPASPPLTNDGARSFGFGMSIEKGIEAVWRARAKLQDRQRVHELWNTPIQFYGRVLDEAGRAVFLWGYRWLS